MEHGEFVWMNGEITPWAEAQVHVLTHALHYGSAVFEGVRVYETPQGPCAFRLADHMRRLITSGRIYGIVSDYAVEELIQACRDIAHANHLSSGYLRPIAYFGETTMKVVPSEDAKVDVAIAAFPLGAYLGDGAVEHGVDVCVSSWRRPAPSTTPSAAKAAGNYLSGLLIGREARARGFAEGIALGADGRLSEGAGENLFLVKDGALMTPPAGDSILMGVTRDTVIRLAEQQGIRVIQQSMPREMLHFADEMFLTGTAAEITPVRSVDHIPVGDRRVGPVTKALQSAFFGLFDGSTHDDWDWLDPIRPEGKKRGDRHGAYYAV
ncbi:MAG: branched-chain amino acid transaminase [Maricaulaceae bacterium]